MSEVTPHPEIWKPIPGWEGSYEVSDHGRVRSVDRIVTTRTGVRKRYQGRVLALTADRSGHLAVSLGRAKDKAVHRLVLEAFIGPSTERQECCHNDGDPTNNNLSNLRWGSRSENQLDRVRHGTHYQAAKTHCPRGHELVSPNLILASMKRGHRDCLACNRAYGYLQYRPGMKHDFQRISDSYYTAIINTPTAEKEAS